jgi:hypothetical protein
MSNELISIGLTCPQCGQQLVGPFGKHKAKLGDILSCPVHGNVGRIEEMTKKSSATTSLGVLETRSEKHFKR